MKRLTLIASFLMPFSALAVEMPAANSPAYQECTALATSNPDQALAKADAWLKIDNGIAAQHCRAMALYGLRRFAESADLLASVRAAAPASNLALRSYLTRQGAKAALAANRVDQALGLLSSQLDEISAAQGDNAASSRLASELLLDRARLNGTYGKLDEAAKDLDHAVSLTPINEEVLLERAGVFERLGDKSLARNDAEIILRLNPNNTGARTLLQRLGGGALPPVTQATPVVDGAATSLATPPVAPTKKIYHRKKPVVKAPTDYQTNAP